MWLCIFKSVYLFRDAYWNIYKRNDMMLESNMGEEAEGGVGKTQLGMNGSLLSWGLILLFYFTYQFYSD